MSLTAQQLYLPKWTEPIHDEWTRNLLLNRPELTAGQLQQTRQAVQGAFFQVQQQADKKYLLVLCVVVQQYYQLGDLLTDTLLQAMQTHRNAAQRKTKERVHRQQQDSAAQWRQVLEGVVAHGTALAEPEQLAFAFDRTNDEKMMALLAWLQQPAVTAFAEVRHAR